MDRNEKARGEFEQKAALKRHAMAAREFAADLHDGKIGVPDRFGVLIKKGDLVVYKPPPFHDLVWEVLDVVPVMDPSRPVGTVRLEMRVNLPVEFFAGQRIMSAIRCGTSAKVDEGEIAAANSAPVIEPPTIDADERGQAEAAAEAQEIHDGAPRGEEDPPTE